MRIPFGRKNKQASAEDPATEEQLQPTSEWTMGWQLGARASSAVLIACLVLGPALGGAALFAASRPAEAVSAFDPAQSNEEKLAGEIAMNATVVWLQAKRGDEDLVAAYLPAAGRSLPERGVGVQEPSVVAAEQIRAGLWSVTVAVTVTTDSQVLRRYFQVPVEVSQHAAAVLTAPAEVAGPALLRNRSWSLSYPQDVASTSPVRDTSVRFLRALLLDEGDISRYLAPDAEVSAVFPAPYVDLVVNEVKSDVAVSAQPEEGTRVEVLITATAKSDQSANVVTYPLTISSRGGRWEVVAIRRNPVLEHQSETTTSQVSVVPQPAASPMPTPSGAAATPAG